MGEIFLTERELAARHQRSVKTLRNARVKGGFIPFVRIGRNVRYRFSDVLAYEAANSVGSTSEPQPTWRQSPRVTRTRALADGPNSSTYSVARLSEAYAASINGQH